MFCHREMASTAPRQIQTAHFQDLLNKRNIGDVLLHTLIDLPLDSIVDSVVKRRYSFHGVGFRKSHCGIYSLLSFHSAVLLMLNFS